MNDIIKSRLLTPEDDDGNRKNVHLVTSAECVVVTQTSDDGSETETTLDKVIEDLSKNTGGDGGIVVGDEEPTKNCIWFDTRK